ncbi:MAG: hypothetical protein ACP5H2_11070 [Solirubrobacteraceae bacterium]
MQRRVFDRLVSSAGALLVVVLLVAGGLLTWASSYTGSQVKTQLAMQDVYFPTAAELKTATKNNTGEYQARMVPYLKQYAGKEVLTGAEAEAFANHFIAYHLQAMPYHGVYSKISAAALAAIPGTANAKSLTSLESTVFQGTTLRGMLLEAYAFGFMGTLAMWGAIASFVGAVILAILVMLGLAHARTVPADSKIFADREVEEHEAHRHPWLVGEPEETA